MAALLSAASVVPPAKAIGPRTGVVTAVNEGSKSFNCHWKTKDWTYITREETVFLVGKKTGGFSDLKVGAIVRVNYHLVGKDQVADRVVISAGAEIKAPK
jgi:hypothetical protein